MMDVNPDSTMSGWIIFLARRSSAYSTDPIQTIRPVKNINESGATLNEANESAT
jgi:hypothetical protein